MELHLRVLGAGVITVVLNSLGANPGMENWALNIHFTAFNWIGALLLWVICGPVALGFLLVAGRNLPAADYGTIAYWEVPWPSSWVWSCSARP